MNEIALRLRVNRTTVYREFKHHCVIIQGVGECSIKPKPVICNNCIKRNYCRATKHYYQYDHAEDIAQKTLSKSRQHIRMSKEDFDYMCNVVIDGLQHRQSLYHI